MSGNPVHVGDDDDDDDDQLRPEIKRIKQNSEESKTCGLYLNYLIKFIQWLIERRSPIILTNALREAIHPATNVSDRAAIKSILEKAPEHCFLDLSQITDELVGLWVVSLLKRSKYHLGASVLTSVRSSLTHLYRLYNQPMPTAFYKGVERSVVLLQWAQESRQ